MLKPIHDRGADRFHAVAGDERRYLSRHACSLATVCRPITVGDMGLLTGRIRDLSATGLSLVLPRWFEPGRVLSVALRAGPGSGAQTVLAHVIQARALPDGAWAVGCAFTRKLGPGELQSVLEASVGTSPPAG